MDTSSYGSPGSLTDFVVPDNDDGPAFTASSSLELSDVYTVHNCQAVLP